MFFLGFQPKKNLVPENLKHSTKFGAALADKTRQARKNLLLHYSTGRPVSAQHAWHVHLFWLILVNPIQYMIPALSLQSVQIYNVYYTYQMMFNFSALHW